MRSLVPMDSDPARQVQAQNEWRTPTMKAFWEPPATGLLPGWPELTEMASRAPLLMCAACT